MSDQRTDADDRVVDQLWKLVAEFSSHVVIALAVETVRGRKPAQVRHSLEIPDDDVHEND
jgi:hypothetical protein